MSKELAKKEETAIATFTNQMYEDGLAEQTPIDKEAFEIPRLILLQPNSPQKEEVDGAKTGMHMNSISQELWEAPRVVPCYWRRRLVLWREGINHPLGDFSPSDVELGLVNGVQRTSEIEWSVSDELCRQLDAEPGTVNVEDTRYHFILVESQSGAWVPATYIMKSTNVKRSKRWMTLIGQQVGKTPDGKKFKLPSFGAIYVLGSEQQQNTAGNKWCITTVKLDRQLDPGNQEDVEIYTSAKGFAATVQEGKVKVEEQRENKGF